jgi:hypothetical protein
MTSLSLLTRLLPSRGPRPHYHRDPQGQDMPCWDEACDHPHLAAVTQRPAWARHDG